MVPISSNIRRLVLAAAVVASICALTPSPSVSAADRGIDPSTLTPPPPDFFNAVCNRAGGKIICDLAFVDPVHPVEEPTGIVCGSQADEFEVLDTWDRTVVGTRYYSADGLLLERHFHDHVVGTYTNSVTGATVSYESRTNFRHLLAVPGDNSTGNESQTGHLRIYSAAGTVELDVGRVVFAHEDDAVIFVAGQHPIGDYFNGNNTALQPLCDALA